MKITKIRFENWRGFKGVQEFALDDVRVISGRNGLGKTTFADAVSYVLCDCNAKGVADFEIRPVANKEPMRGAVYAVTLTISHDGEETTLTRGVRDVEYRRRGCSDMSYKSEGIREIDGVPASVGEYNATIARFCGNQAVKGLTFADWILSLPIAQRRAYLMHLVADSERQEIEAEANKACGNVADDFKAGETIAMYKKRVVARVSDMKKERDANTAKIEENFALITNVKAPSEDEIKKVNAEIKALSAGKVSDDIKALLADINTMTAEVANYIGKATQQRDNQIKELRAKKNTIAYHVDYITHDIKRLNMDLEYRQGLIKELNVKLADAKVAYTEARQALKELPEIPLLCPCCGQHIPDHLRGEWQEREMAKAMEEKNARLNMIIANATRHKQDIEVHERNIASISGKIDAHKKEKEAALQEIANIDTDIARITAEREMVEATDYVATRQEAINAKRQEIALIEEAGAGADEAKKARLAELQEKLAMLQVDKASADADQKHQARILELQEANARLADEIVTAEQKKINAEEYERMLADNVTAKVNAKFPAGLEWVFSEPQANGGIADIAELYVNGVNIRDVNNAMQIVAKLAVVSALQDAHGVSLPIFVDNAESINDLPAVGDRQVIFLAVSNQETLTFNK